MPTEAVSQCKKKKSPTALHEKAKGNKASTAPTCRNMKKLMVGIENGSGAGPVGFSLMEPSGMKVDKDAIKSCILYPRRVSLFVKVM